VLPARYEGRGAIASDLDRQVIFNYVQEFARELGDQAGLRSSVTRAYNLFRRSRVGLDAFIARMHEARSVTRQSGANGGYRGTNGGVSSVRNPMAYWFSILTNLLGVKQRALGGR
jgi:hypothetical protein